MSWSNSSPINKAIEVLQLAKSRAAGLQAQLEAELREGMDEIWIVLGDVDEYTALQCHDGIRSGTSDASRYLVDGYQESIKAIEQRIAILQDALRGS